ncbi:MAG: SMI1/KNR4 family protein [Gemmatimonadaceae bacterium]|nr:SMI1/KNR4 family protein [Chitinophagaceae bacterium]
MSIDEIAKTLIKSGNRLKGVSDAEIDHIEKEYLLKLPLTYKRFLSLMGRGAGKFMQGSSVFYNELFELKNGCEELISENHITNFEHKNSFVFYMHQGYQCAYFICLTQTDPPVFFFSESETTNGFYEKEPSLSSFFFNQFRMSYP